MGDLSLPCALLAPRGALPAAGVTFFG
jgi:hypothetical protein